MGPPGLYFAGAATFGFLTIRPALGFTLSDFLFAASAIVAAIQLGVTGEWRRVRLPPAMMQAGVLIFALGGLVSAVSAHSRTGTILVIARLIFLTLIWISLGMTLLTSRAQLLFAMWCWLISTALSSAGALIQLVFGDVIPGGYVHYGRLTGFTSNPNTLGGLALVASVPAIGLALPRFMYGHSLHRTQRLLSIGIVALVTFGLVASGSVGSLLSLCISLAAFLLSFANGRQSVRTAAFAVGVVASCLLLAGLVGVRTPLSRLGSVIGISSTLHSPSTVSSRLSTDAVAWHRIVSNPVRGVGLDLTSTITSSGHPVHNILLGTWYTAGVFGFIGVSCMLLAAFGIARRAVSVVDPVARRIAYAFSASAIASFTFAMKEPVLYQRYCWLPVAFLAVLVAQDSPRRVVLPDNFLILGNWRAQGEDNAYLFRSAASLWIL